MEAQKIAVVGAGLMGIGIATTLSLNGFPVLLKVSNPKTIAQKIGTIKDILAVRVKKGIISPNTAEQVLDRITIVDTFDWFDQIDLVIESVLEDFDLKQSIFKTLEVVASPKTIFATNTSSLSITALANLTKRAPKVVGMHFFNPVNIMQLVEVVSGLDTDEETILSIEAVCKKIGKTPIRIQECRSFLVNRLLGRYSNEAMNVIMENNISVNELDNKAQEFAMPIGPLALRDMTGLDIALNITNGNYNEYGIRYEPSPLLKKMVENNFLGQKTSKGFYLYENNNKKPIAVNPELQNLIEQFALNTDVSLDTNNSKQKNFDIRRIFLPMINEAFFAIQENIVKRTELDLAMRLGAGMKKGPFQLAEEIGLSECLRLLEMWQEMYGERFRPAPLLRRLVMGKRTLVVG